MKKIFLILSFFLISFNLESAMINSIVIEGNKKVSDETIILYGEIEIKKNYSEKELNEIIQNLNDSDFFQNINISVSGDVLKVLVKEASQLNNVEIVGEPTKRIRDAIIKSIKLKKGGIYKDTYLKADIEQIKILYSTLGYNFAEIDAKVENFENDVLNLYIQIDRGEKTKISKIIFIGDKKLSDRRLRDIIVSEENKIWKVLSKNVYFNKNNIDLDKRLLENYYKSIGYYDAKIISNSAQVVDKEYADLTFNISAGSRYTINKISVNIDPTFDKNLFFGLNKIFQKNAGKYYSPFRVKKILDKVDLIIDQNELQFVNHNVQETINGNNIDIKINITEGKKVLVEKINIIGNTITNEVVIRGELLVDEGDPLSQVKLDRSIAKIKSRRLFSKITYNIKDGSQTSSKIIDINVEEQATGEISAGAGIGTSGGSFVFSVIENNWLGKGVRLNTSVEASKTSLKGGISYTNPNYDFYGNSLTYDFSTTSNDKPASGYENKLIELGIGTRYEQYEDIYISPSLNLTLDDLTVKDTASSTLKKQAGTFNDLALSYAIITDKRDRAFKPTDGYVANFSQSLPIYADSAYIKNSVAFSKYRSLSPDVIGAVKVQAAAINGLGDKDVRISKRLSISETKLRGFKAGKIGPKDGIDYVGGNYSATVNLEANSPNLLPDNFKTELGAFVDFGNLWGVDYSGAVEDSNKIRSSAGINASWLSPVGPMSFTFSQNLMKGSTDETESFNFRLGTTF